MEIICVCFYLDTYYEIINEMNSSLKYYNITILKTEVATVQGQLFEDIKTSVISKNNYWKDGRSSTEIIWEIRQRIMQLHSTRKSLLT